MRFAGVVLGIVALCAIVPAARAQAPLVFTQPPCPLQSGFCAQLDPNATDTVIREFQFIAPKAGKALVTFNGALLCIGNTGAGTVDLITQIVPSGATAVENGPSSNRFGAAVPAAGATPVNLATTRVINYRRSGSYKVAFAIRKVSLTPATVCIVQSAAFTVLYLPVK
jgi:hypothetical protein